MKMLHFMIGIILISILFSSASCKTEPELITVISTVTSPAQTITAAYTITEVPQEITITTIKTTTKTASTTINESTTVSVTSDSTTTEIRTEVPEMEIEIIYEGTTEAYVEIVQVVGFVTTTEVIITGKGQSVLPSNYNIQGIFYDDSSARIGSSSIITVKALPGVKPFEIQFMTSKPLSITKCTLIISDA